MSKNLLGIFPSFRDGKVGGIEVSGAIAWEGLKLHIEKDGGNASLFLYSNPSLEDKKVNLPLSILSFFSKLSAIWKALVFKEKAERVLVWHIGLLELIPFFCLKKKKIVLFLHGIEVWRQQGILTRFLLKKVALFLSNSDYTWQKFLGFNPRLSRIPHQTVHLGFGDKYSLSPYFPARSSSVLMISRLERNEFKGHREMIDAWPLIQIRIPDAQLWIVGDGNLKKDLEDRVKKRNLEKSVHFFGKVSEQKKEELLLQSSCLAMPSQSEGFGIVYIEAMRVGRPCLVSMVDAAREIVNPPEAGLAVDPTNQNQLVDAICRLLTLGEEWQEWSKNAVKRYQHYFTKAHFQKNLVTALNFLE